MNIAEKEKKALNNNKILFLSFSLITFMFILTRIPFFLYGSLPGFDSDYPHYYLLVDQINKGFVPLFTVRTPLYPLFLKLIFTFFKQNIAVIIFQNLLSLITSLFFIFIIHKTYGQRHKYLTLLSAIGLGAFITSAPHLMQDTDLMTESLFVSLFILFFALFIHGLHSESKWIWVFCAAVMASIILTRPSAMFLIPIFILILLFLFFNSFNKIIISLFLGTFVGILLLMSLYNAVTIGAFTISPFSEHALISFTNTFLKQNPEYSPVMNRAIMKCQKKIRKQHKKKIATSWNLKKINQILRRYYNSNRNLILKLLLRNNKNPDEDILFMKWRPELRKISIDAIRSRPDIYLKYFCSNLIVYFLEGKNDTDIYNLLRRRHAILYSKRYKKRFYQYHKEISKNRLRKYYKNAYLKTISEDFTALLLKEQFFLKTLPQPEIRKRFKNPTQLKFFQKIHKGFEKFHNLVFRDNFWFYWYVFALIFSFIRLCRTRFHHKGTFIIFIMTLTALFHGIIVSMSSFPTPRHRYPMDFIFYLSFFLFPILFKEIFSMNKNKNTETVPTTNREDFPPKSGPFLSE